MSKTKEVAGTKIVGHCEKIGAVVGGAGAAVAASAAATNIAVAAEAAAVAAWGGGFFAPYVAGAGLATAPAWWAVLATNPVTLPLAIAGGAITGTLAGYELVKRILR